VASEIAGLISMEHYWNDTEGKPRSIRRVMSQCHFFHLHVDCPGIEREPQR
jgi:hypothetical protein